MELLVAGLWLTQFGMMLSYRYGHTGRVCSGDYSEDELVTEDNYGIIYQDEGKYSIYYMREEGNFLHIYALVCLITLIAALVFLLCCGSCLFLGGSFFALKTIEGLLLNIDPENPDVQPEGERDA